MSQATCTMRTQTYAADGAHSPPNVQQRQAHTRDRHIIAFSRSVSFSCAFRRQIESREWISHSHRGRGGLPGKNWFFQQSNRLGQREMDVKEKFDENIRRKKQKSQPAKATKEPKKLSRSRKVSVQKPRELFRLNEKIPSEWLHACGV